jgi:hypothetical protein
LVSQGNLAVTDPNLVKSAVADAVVGAPKDKKMSFLKQRHKLQVLSLKK